MPCTCSADWADLVRVISRLNQSVLRVSTLDATSYYWHFMGGLWVYLLLCCG